jgi:hypothetical protein
MKPRIIVTGATGRTGSVVVSELLKAGYPVRAMVHREDGRSTRLKAQGAEIAVADLSDFERVADALKDVQRAYFCPPYDPYMIQGAVAFAVAAKEAWLEHIVGLSQWLASPSHPSLLTRQSWLVDRLFSMTPVVARTIVNPGFFADAHLALTGFAAHFGVFPWIFGNSRNAPPSNEDTLLEFLRAIRVSCGASLRGVRLFLVIEPLPVLHFQRLHGGCVLRLHFVQVDCGLKDRFRKRGKLAGQLPIQFGWASCDA